MTNIKFPKAKKLLIALSAFLLFISCLNINFGGKIMSASDFTFDTETGFITGYNGNEQNIEIPSQIAGYTIVGIKSGTFKNRTKILSVSIPDTVTSISSETFSGCSSLKTINFPAKLSSIGNSAFYGCKSLSEIKIPYSVTSVGKSAFEGCISLKKVVIPSSVTEIGTSVFSGCTSLISIIYQAQEPIIPEYFCYKCTSLQYFTIPEYVTEIGKGAFENCSSLRSIDIPENVHTIQHIAFANCSSLKNIYIPETVSILGCKTFEGCTGLKTAILGNEEFLGNTGCSNGYSNTFSGCTSLTDVKILSSMSSLGKGETFSGCKNLVRVEIPKDVTDIPNNTFNNCSDKLTIYCEPDSEALKVALAVGINYSFDAAPTFDNTPEKPNVVKDIDISVNDEYLYFDQEPFIDNGRVMVPLRTIFEALGATVDWNNDTRTVTAKKGSTTVTIEIGSKTMYKNGQPIELDVPAEIQGGRIMVPARAVSEALDCSVLWDNDNRTVIIIK